MSTLGETLRCERLRRGLKAEQIAAEIKITPYMVEAMETGRFDRLPSGSYRRSFLRQYAHILGVNEDEIVAAFKEQYGEPEVALPTPRFRPRKTPTGTVWLALAAVTCIGAYKLLPKVRLDLPDFGNSKVAAAAQVGIAKKVSQSVSPPPAPQPSNDPPPTLDVKPAKTPAAPPIQVALTASEPVWVSVECDGLATYRGMIDGSGAKEFSASTKMTVLVGNAGSLTISLNGHTVGPFGTKREVQLVELTAKGAHLIPRGRKPAPDPDKEPDAI